MKRKRPGRIPFPHPGETIREDYLKPLGMSVNKLAPELRVPATRMTEIVNGRRGIIADTALRLARYFNTTPRFWLNLQASYELAKAPRSGSPRSSVPCNPVRWPDRTAERCPTQVPAESPTRIASSPLKLHYCS
jgi:antitoxin HigA-1